MFDLLEVHKRYATAARGAHNLLDDCLKQVSMRFQASASRPDGPAEPLVCLPTSLIKSGVRCSKMIGFKHKGSSFISACAGERVVAGVSPIEYPALFSHCLEPVFHLS